MQKGIQPLAFESLEGIPMSESVRVVPPFIETPSTSLRSLDLGPTTTEWVRHSVLFLLTVVTTTIAGIVQSVPENALKFQPPPPSTWLDYILYVPHYYLGTLQELIGFTILNPRMLAQGLTFSAALLAILLAHEMGHYIACRRYGVSATLPFFIPAPPLFLAGTFGAFIKMKSPIPSRRALFDIGLAGPLAGFVMLLPIAVAGILTLHPAPPPIEGQAIFFNDPLLFRIFAKTTGRNLANASPNPFYMAAWLGLLVTSLNLMPVGQLDGGHGTFAVFGQRAHRGGDHHVDCLRALLLAFSDHAYLKAQA